MRTRSVPIETRRDGLEDMSFEVLSMELVRSLIKECGDRVGAEVLIELKRD